ncbi:MAG: coproporphyrinogen-III oxidase family protein [Thermoanaerobaculia bacterium]
MTQLRPETSTLAAPLDSHEETEVGSVFVSNYPPFSAWNGDHLDDVHHLLAQEPKTDRELGLYLHIPFCRKRCKFCYFRVYTDKNYDEIGTYLNALATEIETYSDLPAIKGRSPRFIYFGGGTPSYISSTHLRGLVDRIKQRISWEAAEEITFECEPGTLTRTKLEMIREIGVTRLSLGIENFDDDILRLNGRAHLSKEIANTIPWIEEIGFPQLNIDLIAGMVGESWKTWKDTVAKTVDLAPDSVTVYQMELPFNTRFSKSLQEGSLDTELADWDTKRAWHDYAFEKLADTGYEVSSAYTIVKNRAACRFIYRDAVWHGCDLLGTGVASFSHLDGTHFQNVDGWGEYIAATQDGRLPLGRSFTTSPREQLTREFILQLKLGHVEANYFRQKFGADIFETFGDGLAVLEAANMSTRDQDTVRLTRQGLLQVDSLLPHFYSDEYRGLRYT